MVPSCEGGPPYTVTTTSNLVEHATIFADGREHVTFTQTGTAVGVPLDDPSLPTYTAKFTVWGGFNANGQTVNGTFTFNVRGTLSDGSTFSNHVSTTSTSGPTARSTSSSTATTSQENSPAESSGSAGLFYRHVSAGQSKDHRYGSACYAPRTSGGDS